MKFLLYILTIVPLAVLDSIWLFSMGDFYKKWLAHLFDSSFKFFPAVIFYLAYAAGIVYFVVNPAIVAKASVTRVFFSGAFLGFLAYSAYDLTNQATLRNWPIKVTIVDITWGTILTGLAATIAFVCYSHFFAR